ncbi:MAG: ABC transporter ATP-binding protein [Acidobacteria bacterium]|nr:ABC transporter ATP-binding protein [Acidobacteriota bacterium]
MEAWAAAAQEPIISVIGLKKSFGDKDVLRGIDLEIFPGESLVVLGGSGAGKSVFLKHLIGLLQPDEGNIVVEGVDITVAPPAECLELRKQFGMSFQEGALFDSMNVFDNIAFPIRRHTAWSADEIARRVRECLGLVRMEGIEDKLPSELSGGMRRRVGFARAIALQPKILLFDEPTTGLDPINTAAIARVINRMHNELGITAVTITHDLNLAFGIADRLAMIRGGIIIAQGPPDEFRASPDPYVQAFLNGEVPADEEEIL